MHDVRGLCQSNPQAGVLAQGGMRVHQDEWRGCGHRGPGLVFVQDARGGSRPAGARDSGLQVQPSRTVRALPTEYPYLIAPLLVALGRAGIELAPHTTDGERLRHRRPTPDGWAADLPPDLSARLRLHQAAILGLLVDGYAPDTHDDTDAEYILGERMGVADGLGLPTHPGSPAWLVAAGEAMGDACRSESMTLSFEHGFCTRKHPSEHRASGKSGHDSVSTLQESGSIAGGVVPIHGGNARAECRGG